jgi:hypothetical protein
MDPIGIDRGVLGWAGKWKVYDFPELSNHTNLITAYNMHERTFVRALSQ